MEVCLNEESAQLHVAESKGAYRDSFDPGRLLRYIHRIAGKFAPDSNLREDLVQDVLLKAYSTLGRFDPKKSSLDTWLYSMVRSCYIDLLKKESRYVTYCPDELVDILEKSLKGSNGRPYEDSFIDFKDFLKRMLTGLPAHQREAFSLVCIKRLSQQEAANHLQISTEALKSRVKRAKLKLRRLYKEANMETKTIRRGAK